MDWHRPTATCSQAADPQFEIGTNDEDEEASRLDLFLDFCISTATGSFLMSK